MLWRVLSTRRCSSAADTSGRSAPDGEAAGGFGAGAVAGGGVGVTVVVGAVVVGAGAAGLRTAVSVAQLDRSNTVEKESRTRRVTWPRCPAPLEASGPSRCRGLPPTPRRSGRRASARYDKPSRG